jgi:hypothetical protein
MRLKIDTNGVRFRVAGMAKERKDYKDKDKQAVTRDGRPIWTVRLNAVDTNTEHGSSESIWVEVAGDEPKLILDELALVQGLVFAPWVGRDGKIRRAFRADAVEMAPVNGKAPAHAA